jgi:hypothetical protein
VSQVVLRALSSNPNATKKKKKVDNLHEKEGQAVVNPRSVAGPMPPGQTRLWRSPSQLVLSEKLGPHSPIRGSDCTEPRVCVGDAHLVLPVSQGYAIVQYKHQDDLD